MVEALGFCGGTCVAMVWYSFTLLCEMGMIPHQLQHCTWERAELFIRRVAEQPMESEECQGLLERCWMASSN